MASSWNNPLKIEEIGTGEQAGTWGTTTNVNIADALPEAITGRATATFPSDADYTLPYLDSNAPQVFRNLVLNVVSAGSLGATRDLIIPDIEKQYIVENNTSGSQSIRVKTSAGTGVTIPNGRTAHVYCNGVDTRFADDFVDINGGSIDGTPIGASSTSTGAFTTVNATTVTATTVNATTVNTTNFSLTSPLGVTSGGTGLATATQGDILYASASNTYVALPKNTTATRYLANTGTSNNPAWAQIDLTNGVTGNLPVTSGGTNLNSVVQGDILYASAANTFLALPKNTTATRYLANTGTSNNPAWSQIDLTNGVTGTLPVNRGGTGVASVTSGALLLGAGTSALTPLVGTVTGQVVSWNNTSATWEVGTVGASGVTSFSAGTTGLTPSTGTTGAVTLGGVLEVDNGGTGQSSYINGQLLIGNTTGGTLNKSTLTAGTGISITNGAGSITIASTVSPGGASLQVFESNGTFTIPIGITSVKVTIVGGGGGSGGGANTCAGMVPSGGGGGGGACIVGLTSLTPGGTISVTVGGGGSAGGGTAGGTGGTSQIASGTQTITTRSATGGFGSPFASSGSTGATGGLGSGGTGAANIRGGSGSGVGFVNAILPGGTSILGGGWNAINQAGSYGGGAPGSNVSLTGYAGSAGVVIFEW
jgi:hypothetical protein